MVYGIWYMVYGIWYMVICILNYAVYLSGTMAAEQDVPMPTRGRMP